MLGFLKYYILNYVINKIPIYKLRRFYYTKIYRMKIGRTSFIGLECRFYGDKINEIEIKENCNIPWNCVFICGAKIKIDDNVFFGHSVKIYTSDHDPDSPDFTRRDADVHIKRNVWIASDSIILKGVEIGEGAVISAGSVVTKSVGDFCIVAGNPAQEIRKRHTRQLNYRMNKINFLSL